MGPWISSLKLFIYELSSSLCYVLSGGCIRGKEGFLSQAFWELMMRTAVDCVCPQSTYPSNLEMGTIPGNVFLEKKNWLRADFISRMEEKRVEFLVK